MKPLLLILLGVAIGWFSRESVVALEECGDCRSPFRWAVFYLLCIVGVAVLL